MKVRVRNSKNLLFGMFLVSTGIVGISTGWTLPMDTAAEMGPGYMPKILSGILIGFGVVSGASGMRTEGQPSGRWAWRSAALVIGAVVLFGVGIERLGLALTSALVVIVGTAAAPDRRWKQALPFAVALALLCVAIFRVALGLPIRVWPF